ncbi:MAG: ABC transporter permease [Thermoanaerobaculia bacterium]
MQASEAFLRALSNLGVHKLRSTLTMLGMIFGVGAVIAMLSIGAGAEKQSLQMIEKMGLSNILVRARDLKPDDREEIRKKSLGVSLRDAAAIEEAVEGVEVTGPRVLINPYKVLSASGKSEAKLFGVSWRHADLASVSLAEGRFFSQDEEKVHAQVCVIGGGARRDLFGFGEAVGHDIKVNDVWLAVIGILAADAEGSASFQGVSVGSSAREIYIPVTTALRKFDRDPLESPLSELVIRLKKGTPPGETSAAITTLVDRLHGGATDFDVIVPEMLLQQSRRTQRLFNVVMGAIAGISLLVGGVGIMNIMLATVLERTREIGIRRAVGAKRRDIRFQFVVEAFALSVSGGLAGVVMGVAIAKLVAAYAGWPTVVTIASLVLSTGVSAGVGLASGLYPAVRASQLDPIEALRYE